jgi:hypothetical protein
MVEKNNTRVIGQRSVFGMVFDCSLGFGASGFWDLSGGLQGWLFCWRGWSFGC